MVLVVPIDGGHVLHAECVLVLSDPGNDWNLSQWWLGRAGRVVQQKIHLQFLDKDILLVPVHRLDATVPDEFLGKTFHENGAEAEDFLDLLEEFNTAHSVRAHGVPLILSFAMVVKSGLDAKACHVPNMHRLIRVRSIANDGHHWDCSKHVDDIVK